MPPKGTSKTKKAAGMAQPTISFKSRKPSLPSPSKKRPAPARQSSLRQSISNDDLGEVTAVEDDDDEEPDSSKLRAKSLNFGKSESEDKQAMGQARRLDVRSKKYDGLMKDVKVAMGGMAPIHAGPETHNNVHHILRVFDMTSKYGPCVGITRLQRWERAKKWGLNPPDEIQEILTTVEGSEDAAYRETVLHGWI